MTECSATSDAQETIDKFFSCLRIAAKEFTWFLDRNGYIRGTHPEHWMTFEPMTALHFHRTKEAVDTSHVWDVADGPLKLEPVSLALAYAADNTAFMHNGARRRFTELRERLLKAVGLKDKK